MALKPKQLLWLQGTIGVILIGSGLSLAIEASHWKHLEEPLWQWVSGGTLGIALVVIGIISLIKAGRQEDA